MGTTSNAQLNDGCLRNPFLDRLLETVQGSASKIMHNAVVLKLLPLPPHIGKYLAVKTSPNDLAHEEAHLSWNASVHAATGLNQLSRKYISM